MWFKQLQLFQLENFTFGTIEQFLEKLQPLAFHPCLANLPYSYGWVPPLEDEEQPLARSINGNIMICMQFEDKLLPAIVVPQALDKKIKEIEKIEDRKVRPKEKLALKEEMFTTLLPRAFSKISRVYAYINTKNATMILGTRNPKKTELFLSFFKKTISEKVNGLEVAKVSSVLTNWVQQQNHPDSFLIEKAAVLQDPNHKQRVIRCQQQNLFSTSIQQFVKEGCHVTQLAFSWKDRVNFVLNQDLSLSGIQYADEITAQIEEMEAETKQQKFDADFYIMSETISAMVSELYENFN